MNKKQTTVIMLLSITACILGFLVSGRYWFRLDLTKNKAYTISQVSRNLRMELQNPVNITYYLSDKLKTIVPVPGEIEDMLREYAAYSKGKIIVSVRDPVNTGLSGVIEEYGLQSRQIQTVAQDQASFITVFSGIVIEYLDKYEVLPWILSTDTLEYDLTSRIRSMVTGIERHVGIIVGDGYMQWREHYSLLNTMLEDSGYTVRLLTPGEEIPDNLPALFVLGGVEDIDHWGLYRIDRYIQLGGRVLFAEDSIFVDTFYNSLEAMKKVDQGMLEMIAAYGVIIRPELTLDRNALEMIYQTRSPSGGLQYRIVRYPLWISVLGENGNPKHPISSNFFGLDLFWASPLELNPVPNVESTVLFTTSKEGWVMSKDFSANPEIPYMLELEKNETTGEKILGVSLTGAFPSFFRGSPKPKREGSEEELPDMPQQASPSRIIVVGNTNFASNMINVTQANHNLDFMMRAADWLVNDDDIISIRSKQPQTSRLDRIADIDKRVAAMKFAQILNVGIIPLIVIAAGLILASQRRKKSKNTVKTVKEVSGDI
ncbi:MAG: GldG family protein [Treponema sp.]|jgi:gliding-associated putative ABC transporter substrate-binding component GldG|nr:GldG family protein [Treponema sp.]